MGKCEGERTTFTKGGLKTLSKENPTQPDVGTKILSFLREKRRLIINIVGAILCVILLPILIINCVLIVKGFANPNEVPSIGGNTPLIVLTGSMEPTIKPGDLIICKQTSAEEIEVNDVISFFDPEGNGSSVVTHRVIEILVDESGAISFRTQGDNNDIADFKPVPAENLVGEWHGVRFWGLGHVVLFMQSIWGMILLMALILVAIGADMFLRKLNQDKEKQSDIEQLKAELEALKAAQNGAPNTELSESAPPEECAESDTEKTDE